MTSGRIAKAGLISLIGGGTGALFGMILAAVVGRLLGASGTGYFFQIVALFTIAANVLELGADTGLVRELARQRSLGRFADLGHTVMVAVVPVLVVCVVVAGGFFVTAPVLGRLIAPENASAMAHLVASSAPFLLPAALATVLLGATRGLGGVGPYVGILNVGLPVGRVLTVGAVLIIGAGLAGATWAWVAPVVAGCVVAAVILRRQLRRAAGQGELKGPFGSHSALKGPFSSSNGGPNGVIAQPQPQPQPRTPTRELAREFWSFSAPRAIGAAVEVALQWVDVLLVGALAGPAAGGVYAVASRAARAGLLIDTAARMAVSPRISAGLAVGDSASVAGLHRTTTRAMILLSWPLYLTLALFAPVVLTLFGDGFSGGTATVRTLCGAMMLLLGAGMVHSVLLMGGRSRWQVQNKAVALAVNVVGIVILVPYMGILGAGVAWVATVAVDVGLATWWVHRSMGVGFAARDLALPVAVVVGTVLVPGIVMLAVLGMTPAALIVHVVIAGALYATVCWRLRSRFGLHHLLPGARASQVEQPARS